MMCEAYRQGAKEAEMVVLILVGALSILFGLLCATAFVQPLE
jgi:hypothetical protein